MECNFKLSMKPLILGLIAGAVASIMTVSHADSSNLQQPPNSQQVFFVGNNCDGTVTVIQPSGNFSKIGVINMIPDRKERLKRDSFESN